MVLGPTPTSAAVRRAITGLVELFQALALPAKKSVQGLWAELLLIRYATDPALIAAAWHGTPGEQVDFAAGRQRCEVKSSSTRTRAHYFSLAQLTPPASARLIVASVFVESIGGGLALGGLFEETRALLASDPALLARFDGVFYSTLGNGWSEALDERFDLELARSSLQFFDGTQVPRPGDIPMPVSDVRFISDLSALSRLPDPELSAAGGLLAAAVPSQ